MTTFGERLIAAAQEARAIARGEKAPGRLIVPAEIDVRAVRRKTGLRQEDFASQFGFTIGQIRDWEQGRSRPLGGVRAYLIIIEREPASVLRLLADEREAA